jgi:hypothetical protein
MEESAARDKVLALRPRLAELGYIIALVGNQFDMGRLTREGVTEAGDKYQGQCAIGVLKGTDVCDFLRLQLTNGANFDLDTDGIIAKLADGKNCVTCTSWAPGSTGSTWTSTLCPTTCKPFAEDVYDFCPDTLDQGYVGPDLSDGRDPSEMSEDELMQMIDDIGEAIDVQTPADLAEFLRREKRLWLWWD